MVYRHRERAFCSSECGTKPREEIGDDFVECHLPDTQSFFGSCHPHSGSLKYFNFLPQHMALGVSNIFNSWSTYDSIATVGETGVWLRADFQSGSRVLKKVF